MVLSMMTSMSIYLSQRYSWFAWFYISTSFSSLLSIINTSWSHAFDVDLLNVHSLGKTYWIVISVFICLRLHERFAWRGQYDYTSCSLYNKITLSYGDGSRTGTYNKKTVVNIKRSILALIGWRYCQLAESYLCI